MAVSKYKTLNSYGLEESNRYAQGVSGIDKNQAFDSSLISSKTTIAAITPHLPHLPPELEHLLSPFSLTSVFALFTAPLDYDISTLFSRDLVRSFGSAETLQETLDKMTDLAADWQKNLPPDADKKSSDHLLMALEKFTELRRISELIYNLLMKFIKS